MVVDWSRPTTTKKGVWLPLVSKVLSEVYHHFGSIAALLTQAAPLTQLLSKEGFHWNEASKIALKQLNEALTSLLVYVFQTSPKDLWWNMMQVELTSVQFLPRTIAQWYI